MGWPGPQGISRLLTERKEGANARVQDTQAVSVARGSLEEETGGGQPPPSFTAWLYRPYLDLQQGSGNLEGNPQTQGLLLALEAFLEEKDEIPRINGLFTPSTRVGIVMQARTPQFHAILPTDVPKQFRSTIWQYFTEQYEKFYSLNPNQQARLLWLLHRLHMHHAIVELQKKIHYTSADSHYIYALAELVISMDEDEQLEIDSLMAVVRNYPGTWASVEATYHLAAVYGKMMRDVRMTEIWSNAHMEEVKRFKADTHTTAKLLSRFNRVTAFVPQLKGDYKEMVRMMDAAETFAGFMHEDNIGQKTEKDVLHCALYESRAKEAMLIGDNDLAVRRADKFVAVAPRFPVAHFCRGEVLGRSEIWSEAVGSFRLAALYGPPCIERALFYRGNCFEQMGELAEARDSYLGSLASNPFSPEAYEHLSRVAFELRDYDLAEWATINAASL